MIDKISCYRVREKIFEGSRSMVYRGYDEKNKRPVILKRVRNEYPMPREIAYFNREYEILYGLDITGVIKVYGFEKWGGGVVIIQEDIQGNSLQSILKSRKFDLTEFLPIAIKITETLGEIHKQSIVHKDINPENILYNSKTGEIRVIDFGIASTLAQENPEAVNLNVLEGTLPYISPEQTGRMNRPVDYRSDFYSLGVMLYEMLTGHLPFEGNDTLELVHCHLARNPVPPYKLNYKIPVVISNIVMKLMAKPAEDRYQSVFGLISDLKRCLQQINEKKTVEEFDIGRDDMSTQFRIPLKLYGREQEIEILINTFDRVSNKAAELLLVTGYAGIGKSALVYQIYKPVTRKRGYFMSGRSDRLKRNIPYSSLIQVFQEFVKQLLTESEESVRSWKEKLLTALGPNGQVIIEVISEVELITGPQPPVPDLPAQESQNRFNLVFLDFVRAFASGDHPLAVFLDDLQWADSASLNLLEIFLTDPETKNILFIGAYRDNEVDDVHPLTLMLNRVREETAAVHIISLNPLDIIDVNRLVAETLKRDPSVTRPLAELCMRKTGGNPFFLKEILGFLYKEALITFDDKSGVWRWNTGEIEKIGITDNVAELVRKEIQKMPENTQHILKLASCIGSRFDLHTLSIACEKSRRETMDYLWDALREQLILPLDDSYKLLHHKPGEPGRESRFRFSHERVRHSAYALIQKSEKEKVHLEVGRLLLQSIPTDRRDEKIFEILYQLNLGIARISRRDQLDELAELNLLGGKKAKTSAAYQQAFEYFQTGLKLLGDDCWQRTYDLALALHVGFAETAYLNGKFDRMEQVTRVVLEQARDLYDKVKIHEVEIQALLAQNKPSEVVRFGLKVLKLLGAKLPEKPVKTDLIAGFLRTKMTLVGRSIEGLLDLPEMTDTSKQALMRILTGITTSAYLVNPDLYALISFKLVNLSVKYGNSYLSCFAYMGYGVILCIMGDIEAGYRFGNLALRLLQRFPSNELKGRIKVSYAIFIQHRKDPFVNKLKTLMSSYQDALEVGDLEFAAWSLIFTSIYSYSMGKELNGVERNMVSHTDAVTKLNQENPLFYLKINHQAVLNFMGKSADPTRLAGEVFNVDEEIPRLIEKNENVALMSAHYNTMVLRYYFRDYHGAIESADKTEQYLDSTVGFVHYVFFCFFDSLARLAIYPSAGKNERKQILKRVAKHKKKVKKWAHHAPMNHLHRYYLVEAERCRVLDRINDAMEYYDRAIRSAKEGEFLHEEALANERAATFYLSTGKEKIAQVYMTEAHYCYSRWGAEAKVKDLEKKYPDVIKLAEKAEKKRIHKTKTPTTSESISAESLDLGTIMKASQTISGEIVLSRLLEKMMKIVIENAGAQKGFLLMESGGVLRVEAEGFSDREDVAILQSIPLEEKENLSPEIINYVARTKESVVLNDATAESRFAHTHYIHNHSPKSILCLPLIHQDKLTGILYLENNMTTHAFTQDRIDVLKTLTAQAAISIDNALLYDNLEASKEEYRTLFENLNVGVYRTTVELPGRFLNTNPATVKIFGYNSVEEFLKINAADLFVNTEDVQKYLGILQAHQGVKNFEVAMKRKDGEVIWALLNSNLHRDENGDIKWMDGMVEDITERKEAEKELQKHREHLEELVKERTVELKTKNEKIMASIDYARRIQLAILPDEERVGSYIGRHFFLWKPRETVGGDFYWFRYLADIADGRPEKDFMIALVDCTGHGIPGAFMTMIACSVLDRVVANICGDNPARILQSLNRIIRATLNQDKPTALSNDGLDIGLCYVKAAEKKIIYAGAKIPLFYSKGKEIIEVRGDRQSIGYKRSKEDFEYTNHEIILEGDEVFYMTSDGFFHQNEEGTDRMFGKKRFREMIGEIYGEPLARQKEIIEETLEEHMGEETQRDDITVIGFQL